MATKHKLPKAQANKFSIDLIEELNNDLQGIDPSIRSKALLNATNNLKLLIQSLSVGDDIKGLILNSKVKLSTVQNDIEAIEGNLALLVEYIKTENRKHALEKVEKLFKVKDKIRIEVEQLQEINKKFSKSCYSLLGYPTGNGGNSLCHSAANESDSSLNNSSMSLKRRQFASGQGRMNKTSNNSKSPSCLYFMENSKSSSHNQNHSPASLLHIDSKGKSQTANKLRFESIELSKGNNAIKGRRKVSPFGRSAVNKANESFTLSNSSLCLSNHNYDSKNSIPLSEDNISFYQNKIRELIKEVEKINESLIEEKSINTDLKIELNKYKESQSLFGVDADLNSTAMPFQYQTNTSSSSYSQQLIAKDAQIKELQALNKELTEKAHKAKGNVFSSASFDEVEQRRLSSIQELKDKLQHKDKELNEMKELYQSDIQSKILIESLLKSEIQSIQKTYEVTINDLKDTISRKDKEISDLKAKQSSNELSLISQLKQNHQKNISQLKELYTKSLSTKNDSIDALTKQCNALKEQKKGKQSIDPTPPVSSEDLIHPFKEEIAQMRNQLMLKDKTIAEYEMNIDSICKKAIEEKTKQFEMEKLILNQTAYETEVLNEKLKDITEENERFKIEMRELKEQVAELEVKENELMKQIDSKDNEVLELTAGISQMEKKVELKENEIEELKSNGIQDKSEMSNQLNMKIKEYKEVIEQFNRKRLFKQISYGINQLSLLSKDKSVPYTVYTYAFSLNAEPKQPIAFKALYSITTEEIAITTKDKLKEFDSTKLAISLNLNSIELVAMVRADLQRRYAIDNKTSLSFIHQKRSVAFIKAKTELSLINVKTKAFEEKALRKFSTYVLIKPTLKKRHVSMTTYAFSLLKRRRGFPQEKLLLGNSVFTLSTRPSCRFQLAKTSISFKEVSVFIERKKKDNVHITAQENSMTIEGLHSLREMISPSKIQSEQQFSILMKDDVIWKEPSPKAKTSVDIANICSNEIQLAFLHIKEQEMGHSNLIQNESIETQITPNEKSFDCLSLTSIAHDLSYQPYSAINPNSITNKDHIAYGSKSNTNALAISKLKGFSFDITPLTPKAKTFSMSQLSISLNSARKAPSLAIEYLKDNSLSIISQFKANQPPLQFQFASSLQLLRSKNIIHSNESQSRSPMSSKHDEEEEESEYSEDNDEDDQLKEDNAKLQALNKQLRDENTVLSGKLTEVEALFSQEKDEFVGHLRLAFEKLIVEIQISSKAKEYITAIFRMLSYSDDNIFEIYNQLGKKKGLFGFLR